MNSFTCVSYSDLNARTENVLVICADTGTTSSAVEAPEGHDGSFTTNSEQPPAQVGVGYQFVAVVYE